MQGIDSGTRSKIPLLCSIEIPVQTNLNVTCLTILYNQNTRVTTKINKQSNKQIRKYKFEQAKMCTLL